MAGGSGSRARHRPILIVLSGLPGVGKTTVARGIGHATGALHLRLDTIEAAMTSSGIVDAAGGWHSHPGAGYTVAQALARDHLAAGHDVVADSVNPLSVTRDSWAAVAADTDARLLEVELVCTDRTVHRRRVDERVSDLAGLTVPTWQTVVSHDYGPWHRPVLTVDTARGAPDAASAVLAALRDPISTSGVGSWSGLTIDCVDPDRMAEFWATLLGLPRTSEHGDDPAWATVGSRDGALPRLTFQRVPEAKSGKVRIHLDVQVDDIDTGRRRVEDLGGSDTGVRHDHPGEGVVVTMRDPEGHEFCLVHYFDTNP